MSIDYSTVLHLSYPTVQWTGSGKTYETIQFVSTAVPKTELDLLMPALELSMIKQDAIKRINDGYKKHTSNGFVSSSLGTPHLYSGTIESQADLNSLLLIETNELVHHPIYHFHCTEVSTNISSLKIHTFEQLKQVLKDAYIYKDAEQIKLMQQIDALDNMNAVQQKAARFIT